MNFYEILGIPPNAPREEIRAAYLRLAQELHPDRHIGDDEADEKAKFKRIQESYEVLYDPEKRQAYDLKHGAIPPPRARSGQQQQAPRAAGHTHQGPVRAPAGVRRDVPDDWVRRSGRGRSSKGTLVRMVTLVAFLGLLVAAIPQCSQYLESELGSSLPALEIPLEPIVPSKSSQRDKNVDLENVVDVAYGLEQNRLDEKSDEPPSDPPANTIGPKSAPSSVEDILLNESKSMTFQSTQFDADSFSEDLPEISTSGVGISGLNSFGLGNDSSWPSAANLQNNQAQDSNWQRPRTGTDTLLPPSNYSGNGSASFRQGGSPGFGSNTLSGRLGGGIAPRSINGMRSDTNRFGPTSPSSSYPNSSSNNDTYGGNAYQRLESINNPTPRPGMSGLSGWSQTPPTGGQSSFGGQGSSGYGLDAYRTGGFDASGDSSSSSSSDPYGPRLSPYSP